MILTNELYERMKPYERHFVRAVKAGYSLGVTQEAGKDLLDIYTKAGGNKVIRITCASCVYTMLKELGMAYFAYVPEKTEEAHSEQLPSEEKKEEPKKTTKKRSRKSTSKKGGE